MRVALLVPAPFDTISGGYGYDRAIVAGLRQAGHAVDVLELSGRHPLADAAAQRAAAAAWHGLPDEAVPVIDGLCLPAFAPLAALLASRGAVGLIHHPTALETGHDAATRESLRALERQLMPLLARIVVTSEPTAARLAAEFGVAASRVACVVPGSEATPRSAGSGGPGCAILAIGVITPRKGHDVLLRALARLVDLDWTLTLVGGPRDPVHARSLTSLASELGLARRVDFAGDVVDGALETLWQRADLFALASHYEGYGMALAEALRHGLPVVVTQTGAAETLVTAGCGVLCPVGNAAALGAALRRVLCDGALRGEMRDAAWQVGQALPDWTTQARAFARVLASQRP